MKRRSFLYDLVTAEFRKGNIRLALALLIWPRGWSHTRLDEDND